MQDIYKDTKIQNVLSIVERKLTFWVLMFGKWNRREIYLSFYVSLSFSKGFDEFWIIQTNLFSFLLARTYLGSILEVLMKWIFFTPCGFYWESYQDEEIDALTWLRRITRFCTRESWFHKSNWIGSF